MGSKSDCLVLSDYVFDRTWRRLGGLTDDEYFWEPVDGCWSVRVTGDGGVSVDWEPRKEPPPFTTVAWRLWHLSGCYGDDRNGRWLVGSSDGHGKQRCEPRGTAREALDALEAAYRWWTALLSGMPDRDLADPLGEIAGPYAAEPKAGFVLHQLDEMIHHGAEIALLRDLYAARPQP